MSDFELVGTIEFDRNGECHDNIGPLWHHICKYPKDSKSLYMDGNTYIYCVVLTSKWTEHFWAVFKGRDLWNVPAHELPAPDYLDKNDPARNLEP